MSLDLSLDQLATFKPASIFEVVGREFFTDLGKPEHDAYLLSGECYEWYYAVSKWLQPKTILEIGVRLGYSMRSMLEGCPTASVVGYDNESYVRGCVETTRNKLVGFDVTLHVANSQERLEAFPVVDLAHVDGDHSEVGCYHDLDLVRDAKVIICDDTTYMPQVGRAVSKWLVVHPRPHFYVPSYRGMVVIL